MPIDEHECPTLIVAMAAGASLLIASGSTAATSNLVVTLNVASATNVTTAGCATGTPGVTTFGAVQPGTPATTPADCVVGWGSSNDSSMLRMAQTDQEGWAMLPMPATGTTVGWWSNNGGWSDRSAGANAMTATSGVPAPTAGPPAYGSATSFDGSSGLSAPYEPAYDLSSTFTVDLWLRCSVAQSSPATVVAKGTNGGGQDNYELAFTSGDLRGSFSVDGGTWVRQTIPRLASVLTHGAT
ncbi:MAG: hypothetical protein JWM86_2979 [Thermoleophilia bacterium]|nr:hypothetical protein [Thermoleophilia bacterium]